MVEGEVGPQSCERRWAQPEKDGGPGRAPLTSTHLAEEDADLAAAGVTPERGHARCARDQRGHVLVAAVHLRLPAGGHKGLRAKHKPVPRAFTLPICGQLAVPGPAL